MGGVTEPYTYPNPFGSGGWVCVQRNEQGECVKWEQVFPSSTPVPNPPPPPPNTVPVQTPSVPQPYANFSYRIYANGRVDFTNQSSNATSYEWDFGDSIKSNLVNPVHYYSSAGDKTVILKARNSVGEATKQIVIALTILPKQANFTYIGAVMKVFFTDTSTVVGTSFYWTFGDGSISTLQNPIHTYTMAGSYTIKLVTNGIYEKVQTVNITEVIEIVLTQDSFTDTDNTLIANHIPEIGTIDSALAHGKISSNKAVSTFYSGTSYLLFVSYYEAPIGENPNAYCQTTFYWTDPDCILALWFGSGKLEITPYDNGVYCANILLEGVVPASGDTWKVEILDFVYVYQNNNLVGIVDRPYGNLFFYIDAVSYIDGGVSADNFKAGYWAGGEAIEVFVPVASFTTDVDSGIAPLTIIFTDTSTGTPTSWVWDFMDGVTSTLQNPSHIFGVGVYPVKLTVANAYGTSSYIKTIIVVGRDTFIAPDPIPTPPASPQPAIIQTGATSYILDKLNNKVLMFDTNKVYLGYFGGTGSADGQLQNPTWIIRQGNYILVVDSGNNRIQVFDSNGNFIFKFGNANFKGLASNGVYYYATDYDNNKVIVFDMNGVKVTEFGSTGIGRGQFKQPYGIATDSNYIYIVDKYKLQAFTFDYEFVAEIGRTELNNPTDLWIDAINIYINNTGNNEVLVYSRAFNFPLSVNMSEILTLINNILGEK